METYTGSGNKEVGRVGWTGGEKDYAESGVLSTIR